MNGTPDLLTEPLRTKLSNPDTSPDFDLPQGVNQVLADVGMTTADCGGDLTFYGQDPILPSRIRFGTMAAIGLAARSVALAALWRQATGEGQDISVDVRKALRRFCGFNDGKWETINGRPPVPGGFAGSPFMGQALSATGVLRTRDGSALRRRLIGSLPVGHLGGVGAKLVTTIPVARFNCEAGGRSRKAVSQVRSGQRRPALVECKSYTWITRGNSTGLPNQSTDQLTVD